MKSILVAVLCALLLGVVLLPLATEAASRHVVVLTCAANTGGVVAWSSSGPLVEPGATCGEAIADLLNQGFKLNATVGIGGTVAYVVYTLVG